MVSGFMCRFWQPAGVTGAPTRTSAVVYGIAYLRIGVTRMASGKRAVVSIVRGVVEQ